MSRYRCILLSGKLTGLTPEGCRHKDISERLLRRLASRMWYTWKEACRSGGMMATQLSKHWQSQHISHCSVSGLHVDDKHICVDQSMRQIGTPSWWL